MNKSIYTEVENIMRLPLKRTLQLSRNMIAEFKIEKRIGTDTFVITAVDDRYDLELKAVRKAKLRCVGNIDVEFLWYEGEVRIIRHVTNDDRAVVIHIVSLSRKNKRRDTRVPYRKTTEIIFPTGITGYLDNISKSGACLYLDQLIEGDQILFNLSLGNRMIKLKGTILEQSFVDGRNKVRCEFHHLSATDKSRLHNLVVQVKKAAKIRINS